MKKRIFVLLGHPGDKSLTCFFGRQYIEGAKSSDHEVRVEHIGSLDFDPVLWEGYSEVQKLEPDLKRGSGKYKVGRSSCSCFSYLVGRYARNTKRYV